MPAYCMGGHPACTDGDRWRERCHPAERPPLHCNTVIAVAAADLSAWTYSIADSVDCSVGNSVIHSVSFSIGYSVGCSAGSLVGYSVGYSVDVPVGCFVDYSAGGGGARSRCG